MMPGIPIRVRLTAWYSAVLLLGLTLFGLGMWFALEHRLVREVDSRLRQQVQSLRTVLEEESRTADRQRLQDELSEFTQEISDGTLIELRDSVGQLLPARPDRPTFRGHFSFDRPAYQTVERNDRSFRVLTTRMEYGGQTYDVLVAGPLKEVRNVIEDFQALLLIMIPAVLIAACLGGYWISRRALAPVDEITRVAKSISVQNLSKRLTVPRTGDELQRMSETWNEVLERLDAAVKRIRQFTADASHELRTPIALIRATAELALRQQRGPDEYRQALRDIAGETERMTELTESLLTLARSDAGSLEMPLARTDLNRVVNEVVSQSVAAAQAKGIVLEAATALPAAFVNANEAGLRSLLLILIDNALRHTPSGGRVAVSTAAAKDGGMVLAVEDSGEGIAPEVLPRIFERFFRADTARPSASGVGLGLSIAQAIAQAHGSEIMVESAPGAGARFFLTLKT
jgi:heavy metal sensor kinase